MIDANQIKAAVDIVRVVGEHLPLKRVGAAGRYVGLCPFHKEKTPSFNVNQSRQYYKCFGCGVHGDVLDFIQQIEGFSFSDAIRTLAQRSGIPDRPMTYAERHNLAQVSSASRITAVKVADFANGLEIVLHHRLERLADCLERAGADATESLAELHQGLWLVRHADPDALVALWREARDQNGLIEELGREHREHSECVAKLIVDMLTVASATEVAA